MIVPVDLSISFMNVSSNSELMLDCFASALTDMSWTIAFEMYKASLRVMVAPFATWICMLPTSIAATDEPPSPLTVWG